MAFTIDPAIPFGHICSAGGLIWGVAEAVASMSRSDGLDDMANSPTFYPISLTVGSAAVAEDPGALGRLRSVQTVGQAHDMGPYTVVVTVENDGEEIGHAEHDALEDTEVRTESFMTTQKCSAPDVTVYSDRAITLTGLTLLAQGMVRNKNNSREGE